jgi:hypothetical protein
VASSVENLNLNLVRPPAQLLSKNMLVRHQNCGSVFEDRIGNQFMINHFACYAQKDEIDQATISFSVVR